MSKVENMDDLFAIPENLDENQGIKNIDAYKKEAEAVLFMAKEPVSISDLRELLGISKEIAYEVVSDLVKVYENRGIRIKNINNGFIMTTAPDCSSIVNHFLSNPKSINLSKAALEALAIIAYRQPVTRGQIENIRGVNSDAVVSNLIDKKLIKEAGRSNDLGRPFLLITTNDFLKHFGLSSIKELPRHPHIETQLPLVKIKK